MKRLLVAAVAGVAVCLLQYFPHRNDGSGAVLAGLSALIAVAFGLAAVAKHRPLAKRSPVEHLRLIGLALVLGIGLGLANLLVNYGMAALDPVIHEQMVTRWARFSPWSIVIAGPVVEEIAYRFFLMSGFAWIAGYLTNDRRTIFYVALGVSSLLFGAAHVFYGGVDSPVYATGTALKGSAGALLLGWLFWRWGLPSSIVCHCTANGIHLLLIPAVF